MWNPIFTFFDSVQSQKFGGKKKIRNWVTFFSILDVKPSKFLIYGYCLLT